MWLDQTLDTNGGEDCLVQSDLIGGRTQGVRKAFGSGMVVDGKGCRVLIGVGKKADEAPRCVGAA